ncbi:phosphotransferase [Streptomyces pseudovenezuelae]|uniref:phosphotransferase n=1 Tax=Streptomyces pseudovenezuelae TaxID=67350 RepID=UPI002E817BEA|nr:phosphotransferase [Streptomyces pseudovenezuelae]WUA92416.1 phosphotransferase [Streptomyces pseudovenezuelae]
MLGNVWDWCRDVYDAEVYGAYRVLRGGGWFDEHWSCRASARGRSGVSVILMTAEDEVLTGGMANAGAVFRRGDLVERPAPRNARALHAHLLALKQHGFDAAPTPVALTSDGREQLTFVPGDVPLPPFPDWAMTGAALASVGSLLRRLHEAGAAVAVDTSAAWPRDLADPEGGTLLCHNDVCPENVVFRDGRAAALIDFDLAAPGRALWDVAMTARYWVPMLDPGSAAAFHPPGLDAAARLRILADSYGLPAADRAELPGVIEQATEVCRDFVTRRVADGDPVYLQALAERGGWERWDRVQTWLVDHRRTFTAALLN